MTYFEMVNLLQGPKKEILDERDIDFLISIKGVFSLILNGEFEFAVGSINQYFIMNSDEINNCENIMNDVFDEFYLNMGYGDLYGFAIDALLHNGYAMSCGVLKILLFKLNSRHYIKNSEKIRVGRCDILIDEIIQKNKNQSNHYSTISSDKCDVQKREDFHEKKVDIIIFALILLTLVILVVGVKILIK